MQLESDEPLANLDYCRGGWVALEDVVSGCEKALFASRDAAFHIYNLVGAVGGRERLNVAMAEQKLGIRLQYDFAGFEQDAAP